MIVLMYITDFCISIHLSSFTSLKYSHFWELTIVLLKSNCKILIEIIWYELNV